MKKGLVQCDEYLLDLTLRGDAGSVSDVILKLREGEQVVFRHDFKGAVLCRDFPFNQGDL